MMSEETIQRMKRVSEELSDLRGELAQIGLEVDITDYSIRRWSKLGEAVPIFLKHLDMVYSDTAKCLIIETLDVKSSEVRSAWPALAKIYKKLPEGVGIRAPGDTKEWPFMSKSAMASVLFESFSNKFLDEMMDLIRDRKNGETRIILLQSLRRRRKRPVVQTFLAEAIKDPQLSTELGTWSPVII